MEKETTEHAAKGAGCCTLSFQGQQGALEKGQGAATCYFGLEKSLLILHNSKTSTDPDQTASRPSLYKRLVTIQTSLGFMLLCLEK